MKTYEYIFAAVIMVAILIAAALLTSIAPQLYMSISNVEQLKMAAQKVMAQLLLSPGEPEDWGENVRVGPLNLSSLGLAVSTTFTREAYILDPDKLQRLSDKMPRQLYVPPSRVVELLNLGLDYGVRIELISALNVNIALSGSRVEVFATSEQGLPLAGARVIVRTFYINDGKVTSSVGYGSTDPTGKCVIDLAFKPPAFIIVLVDYHGIRAMNATTIGDVKRGVLVGRSLLLRAGNITEAYQVSVTILFNRTLSINYVSCDMVLLDDYKIDEFVIYEMSDVEPNTVAVIALTNNGELVAAWRDVPRSYSSLAGIFHPPAAYTLERSVRIGPFAYTLRLTVWRMSW